MHDLHDLLASLRDQGVQLWVGDGRLKYRAPAGLSERLRTQIRQRKDALIAHLERGSSEEKKAPRPSVLPLSYAQEGLWFLYQLNPSGAAYNLPIMVSLRGVLDEPALVKAFYGLEKRHEVLRTRYPDVQGEGTQEILAPGDLDIEVVDPVARGESGQMAGERLLQEESEHRFELSERSPFRVRLLRLGDHEHLMAVNMHHIVADAAAVPVLFSDLADLYRAARDGRPSGLPELPVQFADVALDQRRRIENGDFDDQLRYWEDRLGDAPECLDLPTDRPRPAVSSFAGGLVEFRLTTGMTARLLDASRKRGMTTFMFLSAAFQLLLSRWSGQTDLSIGTPVVIHGTAAAKGLIGYFLNTLVLRAHAAPDLSVDAFFEQARQRVLEAFEHRDVPFDVVVASLRPTRQQGANPLFQALFAFDEVSENDLKLPGLDVERVLTELRSAKFDLSLFLSMENESLRGGFEYATDLFDRRTIERLTGHFERLLESLLGPGDKLLGALPLLGEAERNRILVEWNDTAMELPEERTMHGLISERAAEHGSRLALVHGQLRLSYAELDRTSNQIANCLVSMGVGPEEVVGICVNRSPEMLVGLLGILKAGAAYLPLDPSYPSARRGFMLSDSSVRVLLSTTGLVGSLPEHEARVLFLDRDRERIAAHPAQSPKNRARSSNLAYVIYTSGSTGRPKGVALQHGSATAFLTWAQSAFSSDLSEATLAATSICFDLSVFELFAPLVAGGVIVLVDDASSLAEEAPALGPTLINTVPSAARALLDADAIPTSVTTINLAGEPLPRSLVESLYEAAPRARVINLYGPSEYTTYSTWCHVDSDPGARVSIGTPVANTKIYLLDEGGEPVPIGTPGEIFIAGAGLARGYVNRPSLTAERFVPNPFGPPGARMYATGDLGRYRADGKIDYLGRLDQQVKVRGFRIEPGEIEARLQPCAGVAEVAVVPRLDRFGYQQLVAHVVADDSAPGPRALDLQTKLRNDLPDHMIPAVFEFRDKLPLTPNGKIDRKALAEAPPRRAIERARYVAPRDSFESLVAEVWSDVLRLERVGIDDNFFALGGHSLLAARIIARLKQDPDIDGKVSDLFLAPTVSQLAERLSNARGQTLERLTPVDRGQPILASFAQQRMWFIDQLEPGSGLYNVPIAWRLSGELHLDALRLSLVEILRRHEVLRTTFVSADDGTPRQIIADEVPLPLPLIDLSSSTDPKDAADRWLQQDAAKPFDLARGPLFRAALVKLADKEHIVQLGMPHIVADGWSLDVILSELGALYPAFMAGNPSPLPPLSIQYADYACWERQAMQGEVLEDHMSFWRKLLDGAPKQLRLPWDRPRPPAASYEGEVVEFVLDPALSEALRELARGLQVTLFMVMAAIFNVLLFRYSRQKDFCVGYSVGNRSRIETEGLIGPFVNILVLRARMNSRHTFVEHLAQVRQGMLEADAHQEFPFEKMVEEYGPERDLAHHPIFQVTYSYSTTHGPRTRRTRTLLGVGEQEVSLPGLEIGLVEPEYQTAKFDLAMFISDTGDVLEGDLEFATDLFDRSSIERLAVQLEHLCRSVVDAPRWPLGELDILPGAERTRILVDWNRTSLVRDAAMSIHGRIERQAAHTPDAVALHAGSEAPLCYAELNERANRLAHHLRGMGVGPETLVAVCLSRRAELVVTLLGVLKAGGAYAPLDPTYPSSRLHYMLQDSGAPILVSSSREASVLPAYDGRLILLDALAQTLARESPANPVSTVSPQNLAYCLYTSGSTGDPKAVALQHDNALALLAWAEHAFSASETERVLATTSVCFDLSIFEIFLPLVRGGTVVLLDDIAASAMSAAPSLINTVPSAIQALATEHALPESARVINLAGEALAPSLVAALEQAAPAARIVNLYGPTEYTTYATYAEVGGHREVTIGRPIGNTRVYILDQRLEPTPIGVDGELHIAGAGLARGYLGRASLTAERFLPNPFGPAGDRMYATGDRARYLADGRIEFLGRQDHQVKFHGYRIELGEIEHELRRCSHVDDAAVIVTENSRGDPCLAGFVAVDQEAGISADSVLAELGELLPRPLLPDPLVLLNELPRTPNGKVDRNALRIPETPEGVSRETRLVPPGTPTEVLLANIWKELLGITELGIHESFFALGGHSMSAIRLVARVGRATGFTLPLRSVFEHPTISTLAGYIQAHKEDVSAANTQLGPIPRLDRRRAARGPGHAEIEPGSFSER